MFNFNKHNSRKKVVVFGTGGLASLVTKAIRSDVDILNYTDNNSSLHGKRFMGRTILSPTELSSIKFDALILASQAYKEIEQGLIDQNIAADINIEYFTKYATPGGKQSLRESLEQLVFEFLSNFDNLITRTLLDYFYVDKGLALKSVSWLDEQKQNIVQTLANKKPFLSTAPHYLGTEQSKSLVEIPAVILYRFKNAVTDYTSRTWIIDDRLIIERGLEDGFEQGDYSGGRLIKYGKKLSIIKCYEEQLLDKALVINAVSDGNYYHCIIELFSQLYYLDKIDARYSDYPILLPKKTLSIASLKACFDSLNIDREVILMDQNKSYMVNDLLVITTPNNNLAINLKYGQSHAWQNYLRHETLNFISDCAINQTKSMTSKFQSSTRIYIGRKGPIRSFNQDEITELLMDYGFECYYTEDLSFLEQVSLFQNAEYIVGPTGAAWANLIFSQKGAKALCWQAENLGDLACYPNLATAYSVNLEYLTYKTNGKLTRELFWENYQISLQEIKSWLESNT